MVAMGEFQIQNHNGLKGTQRLITHLPKNIFLIPKTFGFLPVTSGVKKQKKTKNKKNCVS